MYLTSILDTPLRPTGPVDPAHPSAAVTADLPFVDGVLQIGVWECTPGAFDGTTGDFDEIMYLVSGRATVTYVDDEGVSASLDLSPGTLWVTPRNWSCTWAVHQTIRKMYVIDHRPGVWECTPREFPLRRDGWSEIVAILSSRATIHADTGMRLDLGAGSVYYTPVGFTGRWQVHETIRKAYGIIRH